MKQKIIYLIAFISCIFIFRFLSKEFFGHSPDVHDYLAKTSKTNSEFKYKLGSLLSSKTDFKKITSDSLLFRTEALGTKSKVILTGVVYQKDENWNFYKVVHTFYKKEENLDTLKQL